MYNKNMINNYRIKNFAVGGYGTYQSFLRLEEILSKKSDTKIVVAIYVEELWQ